MGRPRARAPLQQLTVRLPELQLEWLASRAERGGIGVGEVLRRIVADEIERQTPTELAADR